MKNDITQQQFTRRHLLGQMAAAAVTGLGALSRAEAAPWARGFELAVNFEINQPGGGRYHRPYVAVWIEDAGGRSVRTLSLWLQTAKPGPRWFPDLKRWYRGELARRKRDGGDLIDVVSSATRMPGRYSVIWNGRDDDGQALPQGRYFICLEAAREHGTYQIIRQELQLGTRPFRKDLGGNIEIKEASVEYRKR